MRAALNRFPKRALERRDRFLVASVERPLLDALGVHEPRGDQYAHVLTDGRLADAELRRDEHTTDTVVFEVTVNLRREVLCGCLEPIQDLQATTVVDRAERVQ